VKKSLQIIALLFVVIGTPNAHATPSKVTFTCAGLCAGGTPTAPDVSFPSPTTITETWDGFTLTFTLAAPDSPKDMYIFANAAGPDSPSTYFYLSQIIDLTNGNISGLFAQNQSLPTAAITDFGTVSFTPEPSTWIYAITGVGFLLLIKLKALYL
jgi:hypothetical protein